MSAQSRCKSVLAGTSKSRSPSENIAYEIVLVSPVVHCLSSKPAKSICIWDHGWSILGKGLYLMGGALAAKAQPLQDFMTFSISLSMFG